VFTAFWLDKSACLRANRCRWLCVAEERAAAWVCFGARSREREESERAIDRAASHETQRARHAVGRRARRPWQPAARARSESQLMDALPANH
jgi:hypothetical protein